MITKNRIKEIREEMKITRVELADILGFKTSKGELQHIENGSRIPNVGKAISIAEKLGKTVEEIWYND